jgi:ABC-type Fe3+ transport system substrate-binding protein
MLAPTHAATAASPVLLKDKKEAAAKGYIFLSTHDEIVAMAKKEGRLRVSSGFQSEVLKPLANAFKQKYSFITDIHVEEIRGNAAQRILAEIQAGQAKEWDITNIPIDHARDYPPYLKKLDILGMANQGVLKIDPRMVHPVERNMVGVTTSLTVIPYNKKLISEGKVPAKWEDFLKPEFKGRKFILEIRPTEVAALVPALGLERTLEFARKLVAQEPVWGISGTRTSTAITVGEYPFSIGASFDRVKRVMDKNPTTLSYKVIEPIPARITNHPDGIINTAARPHAALLWLEFLASPEGQEIIDKYASFASLFTPGSVTEQMTRGKKLSVVDWDHFTKFQEYTEKLTAAYGFPKADLK